MQYSPSLISHADPSLVEQETELDPDVKNPLYDLLVQDEELEAAGQRAYSDLEHMLGRLSGLDEAHPAFEPLVEVVNSRLNFFEEGKPSFAYLANTIEHKYRNSLRSIEELNNHQFLPKAVWFLALVGVGSSVATGIPVGSAAAGAVVGNGLGRAGVEIRDARRSIDYYLEFADDLHGCREEFDVIYAKLVPDEDQAVEELVQEEV